MSALFGLWRLKPVPILVAVASISIAVLGFSLYDTDPSIWRYRLWLVKEVLPGTIIFSVAGAVCSRPTFGPAWAGICTTASRRYSPGPA